MGFRVVNRTSSRQGPGRRQFFCTASTSYYEESDQVSNNNSQKNPSKSMNSHQKTQEYIKGKSPLFIL